MTLEDLAQKCTAAGVSTVVPTLSRIERGIQIPRPKLRSVLASLLELDPINDFGQCAPPDEMTGSAA